MMGDVPSTIGAYRVVRSLGEGGMGAVYEAVHEAIERRVAIKVLHQEFARSPEITARFFNEARAVNRVEHAGLVQISDYGQQPDGTAYIVMELLKGESLSQRLERCGGKLAVADVVQLSWQIADALAAAHTKDIVHRDLKPDNVMMVPEPHMPGGERTKLLDFGIAKVADQGEGPRVQTKTDQFMGTPLYMSPEQCEGAGRVDAKSDVYSLGVMMFEMLSGMLPFEADGPGKILAMHLFIPPPLLKEMAPHVPHRLADLVQGLLIKDREQRPTMREVVNELAALCEQYPLPRPADSAFQTSSPVNPLYATTETVPEKSTPTPSGQAPVRPVSQPRRRGRRLRLLVILVSFLVVLSLALLIVRGAARHKVVLDRLRQGIRLIVHATDPEPGPARSDLGVSGPPRNPQLKPVPPQPSSGVSALAATDAGTSPPAPPDAGPPDLAVVPAVPRPVPVPNGNVKNVRPKTPPKPPARTNFHKKVIKRKYTKNTNKRRTKYTRYTKHKYYRKRR